MFLSVCVEWRRCRLRTSDRMDCRGRGRVEILSEVRIGLGSCDSLSISGDYDKCRLFYYVSNVITCVCLSFSSWGGLVVVSI